MNMSQWHSITTGTVALAGLLALGIAPVLAADRHAEVFVTAGAGSEDDDAKQQEKRIVVKVLKDDAEAAPAKDRAWLGVAVEEATETLTEQLGLDAGVGLVVIHVTPDSPAAKAGLKKNDVLVELADQSLVHPAQFRKLVQARKPGDKIKLQFYRAGKRQTESITLDKAPARFGSWDDGRGFGEDLHELQRELRELPVGDAIRAYTKSLQENIGQLSAEHGPKIQIEIQRSMEQARKAIQDAARQMKDAQHAWQAEKGPLKDLLKSGISVDDNATVVVRSTGKSSRSIVKSDEWGTLTLVGPPNRLTARDKSGKELFDGEIESPEQRAKVPPEVWERVEPLLHDEKLEAPEAPKPPKPPKAPKPPTSPETSGLRGSIIHVPSALAL